MKKLCFMFCLVAYQLSAQTSVFKTNYSLELDPIAYVLKGYSFHGILQPSPRISFDVGIFGIEEPEGFSGNEGFTIQQRGFGIKANYHFQEGTTRGLYTGFNIGYATADATHKASRATANGNNITVGAQLGYRFFLSKPKDGIQKGLYIVPWFSYGYVINTKEVVFSNLAYDNSNWLFFPTVHFGYRF